MPELDVAAVLRFMTDQRAHNKKMERLTSSLILQGRRSRIYGTPIGGGPGTATLGQPFVLDFGGPNQGFVWELKQLHIGPSDYTATVPGGLTSYIFVGKPNDYSAGQIVTYTAQFPAQAFFGTHEAWVMDGERVYGVVTGAPTGQVITGSGLIIQSALDYLDPLAGVPVAEST